MSIRPALLLGSGALTVLSMEALLQVVAFLVPPVDRVLSVVPLVVEDPRVRHRLNPEVPDHDASGWRNAERFRVADAVALGDSQTYGQIVRREEAWPQQLGTATGERVYNMGIPGHGPVEYLRLVPEALALQPRRLLVGVYSGNDLMGAYSAVYREEIAPELRSSDPEVRAALEEAGDASQDIIAAWERTRDARIPALAGVLKAVLDPIRTHSKLWGMARAFNRLRGDSRRRQIPPLAARHHPPGDPDLLLPVYDDRVGTVLTPAQRRVVVDLEDPRIVEGLRITQDALRSMSRQCTGRCELVVVQLPTKELVFEPFVRRVGASMPGELRRLLVAEREVWRSLSAHLERNGIAFVDTLGALRRSLADGESPFPGDQNGHLNAVGNRIVADAVAESFAFEDPPAVHR